MTDSVIATVEVNRNRKGWNVLDCPSNTFIKKLGEFFKEKNLIKLPKWTPLVKCSHANELSPLDADWLFYKAAAICRQVYISKSINIGIGTLKAFFGKKKRNGVRPPKFTRSAGKIIREIVTQLKKNGYVENYANQEGATFGLVLTKTGRAELDKIASKLIKDRPLGQ